MTDEAAPEAALQALRRRFDDVDDALIALIAERLRLADEAAPLKRALGRGVVDLDRETAAARRRRTHPEAAGIEAVVEDVFAVLVAASRARQQGRPGEVAPADGRQ